MQSFDINIRQEEIHLVIFKWFGLNDVFLFPTFLLFTHFSKKQPDRMLKAPLIYGPLDKRFDIPMSVNSNSAKYCWIFLILFTPMWLCRAQENFMAQ